MAYKGYDMNRSERLTHILEFLKSGMSFSIDEIAQKYAVSDRTVFRDIKTLKKLGYKVDFDNGYKLVDSAQVYASNNLSNLHLELIYFVLKTHPLREILLLNNLSEKILENISNRRQEDFFAVKNQKVSNFKQKAYSKKDKAKLASFINAAEQHSRVYIKTRSGKFNGKLSPTGIVFDSSSIQLHFSDNIGSDQIKVSLSEIELIKIVENPDS